MDVYQELTRPSKKEQRTAMESYQALISSLDRVSSDSPEIEIEETEEKIRIPLRALKLLAKILEVTSKGKPISIVPVATEMTTQASAEFLGCSRPHLVRLLEEGKIPFTMIGKHRRVKFEDLIEFKAKMKAEQKQRIIDMMRSDEESGMYDS
jgi:excisionase family DNA binding protein